MKLKTECLPDPLSRRQRGIFALLAPPEDGDVLEVGNKLAQEVETLGAQVVVQER